MSKNPRDFDLVVFGATGFTGRLVADYIASSPDHPRWAIAGRNAAKLEALGFGVPILLADAGDRAQLDAVARRTKAIATTVGPYARYGEPLVAACAEAGTHYCDLSGEVHFMRRMIDRYHERARQTGARIVHASGFDSIPSDLGTWALQQEMIRRFGAPARSVTGLFGETSGGISGGTFASAIGTARAAEDRDVRRVLANPYALDPDPRSPDRPPAPDERALGWDRRLGLFTAPFIMAGVNTRVVRRGHAISGFPWGADFVYREVKSTPGSARGLAMAVGLTGMLGAFAVAVSRPRIRELVARRGPQPGDGPTVEQRANGHWKARFVGEVGDQRLVYEAADDDGDPGYRSTAKMLGESALCLAFDPLTSAGGCTTPAVAMGGFLLDRLRRAGLTFLVA